MAKLCSSAALPREKGLFRIAFWWRHVALKQRDVKTFARERKASKEATDAGAHNSDGLIHDFALIFLTDER